MSLTDCIRRSGEERELSNQIPATGCTMRAMRSL